MMNSRFSRVLSVLVLITATAAPALAQGEPRRGLSPAYRLNGRQVTRAFGELTDPVRLSTVTVIADGKAAALGAVVDTRGYIVTKASELTDALGVTTADGRSFRAERVDSDPENDLALLKIGAENLTAVTWGKAEDLSRGHMLATVWPQEDRVRIGVVAATRRAIQRSGGVLGIGLGNDGENQGGVQIERVFEDSGAAEAGLRPRDIVASVNGKPVQTREELIKLVTTHDAGEVLTIGVIRDGEKMSFDVTLGHRSQVFNLFNRNLRMSGETSKRSAGFVDVIQHDIPIGPDAVGGPLVDLDGEVIGLNIARVDRVATYALPAEVVSEAVGRMIHRAEAMRGNAKEPAGKG